MLTSLSNVSAPGLRGAKMAAILHLQNLLPTHVIVAHVISIAKFKEGNGKATQKV